MNVSYDDILRVWSELDDLPEIADAWLWDHMLPLVGPKDGPIYEGWTLLAALAARTDRLGLGLLVTNNGARQPAVLGKISTTVDVISGGRLIMGIGVGGTRLPGGIHGIAGDNPAVAEFEAYGLELVSAAEGTARLAETIAILKRMWSEKTFDFDGRYYTLKSNYNEPKPVRTPRPPLLIGGAGTRTLRLVAEHADIWNVPGPPHGTVEYLAERAEVLREQCEAIGRDPAEITHSVQTVVSYDNAAAARETIKQLVGIGVSHVVLGLPRGYPVGVGRWLVGEIITPIREEVAA
jgi:alkanesulfonate monooxygenase SsuD/methylene tetrahydromethanopterin reductase-like flavin-dependent oxidoreductase (luciferase family)